MILRGNVPVALAGSWGSNLLSLLWVLICVVAIIALAYLFTRYVAGRGGLMVVSGGNGRFKVLARLSLGREQSVALVQAGERYFLLGVTASGIQLLTELTKEEADALRTSPPEQPQPPSFRESLRTVLQQRKPR